jgi:hypothetical protein
MIQNIIVAFIVVAAVIYAGNSVYRSVRPGKKPGNACGGCTGCELKNMKNTCGEIIPNSGSGINNKEFSRNFYQHKKNIR